MSNKNVVVYSTKTWPYCNKLKEYLSKNDIDFTEYNVAENKEAAMEMVEKTKQMGVPVTIIDDTDIIVGYDPLKLDELLKTNS